MKHFRKHCLNQATPVMFVLALTPSVSIANEPLRHQTVVNGNIVTVMQAPVAGTLAISSLRITNDQFTEIRVDSDFDGKVDIREFSDRKRRVRYSMPINGTYHHVELEERMASGLRYTEFFFSLKLGHYLQIYQELRPYRQLTLHGSILSTRGHRQCRITPPPLLSREPGGTLAAINPNAPDTLRNSAALDSSCRQEPFAQELGMLQAGVEQVLNSRRQGSNQFVGCLKTQGLGYFATRLDEDFDAMLTARTPALYCKATTDDLLGSYFENADQSVHKVSFHKTSGVHPSNNPDGPVFYADITFHEKLHAIGINDEATVLQMVACCGSTAGTPSANEACVGVKKKVAAENLRNSRLNSFVQNLEGFPDFWQKIRLHSEPEQGLALFEDWLDTFQNQPSLFSRTTEDLVAAAKTYFETRCKKFFPEAERNQVCDSLSSSAQAMVRSNANKSCTPEAPAAQPISLQNSCLGKAVLEARQQVTQATNNGTGVVQLSSAALQQVQMDQASIQNRTRDRNKTIDSYYTALHSAFPKMDDFLFGVERHADQQEGAAIVTGLFQALHNAAPALQNQLSQCQSGPTECNSQVRTAWNQVVTKFFSTSCRTYFTATEGRTEKPCLSLQTSFNQVLDGVSANCAGSSEPNPGVMACALRALEQGQDNFTNYNARAASILHVAESEYWYRGAEQARRDAAQIASGTPLTLPTDPSINRFPQRSLAERKDAAQRYLDSSLGSTRPDSLTESESLAFNSSDPNSINSLREAMSTTPSSLQTAASVLASTATHLGIPAAEAAVPAESHSDHAVQHSTEETETAAISPRTEANSLASPSATEPALPAPPIQASANKENTLPAPVQGSREPVLGRPPVDVSPNSPFGPPLADAQWSAPATSRQRPTAEGGRAPTNDESTAETTADPTPADHLSVMNHAPRLNNAGASQLAPRNAPITPGQTAQRSALEITATQERLIDYIRRKPEEALIRIKNGIITRARLIRLNVQIEDENGNIYGPISGTDVKKIKYRTASELAA